MMDDFKFRRDLIETLKKIAKETEKINAGETYVKVHTQQYPPGEIRGRIEAAPAPALPTLALLWQERSVVKKGDRFSLQIMAKNVTAMQKFSFELGFNPKALEVEQVNKASFLSWQPSWRPGPEDLKGTDIARLTDMEKNTPG